MKTRLLLLLFLMTSLLYAQESFKKAFQVRSKYIVANNDTIYLKKEQKIMFNKMTDKEQEDIRNKYPLNTILRTEREEIIDGDKIIVIKELLVDEEFYNKQFIKKSVLVTFEDKKKANVKLVDNKLIVNPYVTIKDKKIINRELYQFELLNRQTIKLRFNEFTVSGLLVPIKYRFKDPSNNLPEEFSVSPNAHLFFGFSMGKTSFHYREKVDNVSNTWKITFGGLVGATSIKLNSASTSLSSLPLTTEQTKGAATIGLGLSFSFNKINLGVFYGIDYAFGDEANKWNYNKKPWLGAAIGYSLFNF
ncbi:hypothetical protein [Flavobacterium sp.]